MIIQNQNNPLAPVTGPDTAQLVNAFEQHAASFRGEVKAESTVTPTNPFKSSAGQQDAQQAHIAATEQYAAPIGVNIFDTESDYTDEHHKRFAEQLNNDPAFKEIEGPFYQFVTSLRDDLHAGNISHQDAMAMLADYGQNEIDPILDKHHGPHSESHKISLHNHKGGK